MSLAQSKTFKVFRFILLLPVFLTVGLPVILFFGTLGLYAYVQLICGAFSTKWKMNKKGRSVSEGRLKTELSTQDRSGTFILESYTIGWPVARLWWTPDAISKEDSSITLDDSSSDPHKKLVTPYYGKIYDSYTDLEKGKAFLWKTWVGKSTPAKIGLMFPNIPIVELWSGGIEMERRLVSKRINESPS